MRTDKPNWRRFSGALSGAIALTVLFCSAAYGQTRRQPGDVTTGKKVYEEICFACHGEKGDGKGPSWFNTKPSPQVFINSVYMSRLTDEYIFNVVKYGKLAVLNARIPD